MTTPFKRLLQTELDLPLEKALLLPRGYQRVGDLLVVSLHPYLREEEQAIGRFLLKRFRAKGVFRKGPVFGELKTPGLVRIAGRRNATVHKENGCLYAVDLSKVMFSRGNSFERGRIVAGEGEAVADLFAGIGYFTIPIAKRTPSCQVIAVEKNPAAVKLLKENVRLNRLGNVEVVEGDCREVGLKDQADRVVMGYFPETDAFLPAAFRALRRTGILHFHNLYRRQELWKKPLGTLETRALESGYRVVGILGKRVVKSYSPGKLHVVIDAQVRKS